jgi:hypothetical protein
MRILMPDGFVLMFWPTRLPGRYSQVLRASPIILPQDGRLKRTRSEPSRDLATPDHDVLALQLPPHFPVSVEASADLLVSLQPTTSGDSRARANG